MASLFAVFFLFYPQQVKANELTAADVLEWQTESQDWYFQTSITMAGIVASQNKGPQAKCINDWYFAPDVDRKLRHDAIRSAMRKFAEYHPGTVILVTLQKACGPLVFTNSGG